jgi:diguanylate cyclase (GGDEF)-like protein
MTRVLVADTSAEVRELIHRHLAAEGYEVVEASTRSSALELAVKEPPDVILFDVEMPGLEDDDVLGTLRADENLREIPVVILSARAGSPETWALIRDGAHDELRKPFADAELMARVAAAARVKSLQDELRRRNAELERLSRTDALTGVYNRRHLDEQLGAAASAGRRYGLGVGVVLMDIDRFKQVNDTFGHAAGDAVLSQIANRLASCIRAEDILGRWGGEEFIVICPFTGLEGARALAERMRSCVSATPIVAPAATVTVTISAGCAAGLGTDPDGLVRAADRALYAAKAAGRDRVELAAD